MRKIFMFFIVLLFSYSAFSQEECQPHESVFTYYYSKPLTQDFAFDTIYACDPDINDVLTWSYVDASGFWSFDDGKIKVGDAAGINLSSETSFSFTVKITDNGDPSLSNTSTINLIETNGEPIIAANQVFSIDENLDIGTLVGTVDASDPNNQNITFVILSGNDRGLFEIDVNTGVITTTEILNFEDVVSSYSLEIQVTDSGTIPLTATGTITINVTDVNEAPIIYGGN